MIHEDNIVSFPPITQPLPSTSQEKIKDQARRLSNQKSHFVGGDLSISFVVINSIITLCFFLTDIFPCILGTYRTTILHVVCYE